METSTLRPARRQKPTFGETINSSQGLIIILLSAGLFVCVPFVGEKLQDRWIAFCGLLLTTGATLSRPAGDTSKSEIHQQRIEGAIVNNQTNETDPTESSTY